MLIAGGREGIMGAVQRGAGRAHSFALSVRLPSERRLSEPADVDPKLVTLDYFFTVEQGAC
jgi:predicted Rossmann-fold nucleotide-binding protein